ncbi:hypothetical protein AAC387_Pa08g1314 [Persea americana]
MRQLTQRLQSRFADQASTSRVNEDNDLPGYLFEELPDKDPGSSSNWYDFSDDEKELSDDTDARFSDLEESSSPKEVPYFDPVSVGEGKVPGSLQLQNLCSVSVVYPVDWPGARSTGDTASGSLEPDENTISPFSLTTVGRPAHGSVDRAHRRRSTCFLQVDRGTVLAVDRPGAWSTG